MRDDFGIPDWGDLQCSPAVRSPSILMGMPRGRVSDRTRNVSGRSDRQQGEAAREDGASGADSKRELPFVLLLSWLLL